MSKKIDLIGVGSPVVDLLAQVDDSFLEQIGGEKGGMELVDDLALEDLVSSLENEPAVEPGGSSGNTAYTTARLGAQVAFLGKLGNCEAGNFYRDRFESIGADISRFKLGDVPNARCLSLVTPDSQRTMRTDLGAAMTLTPEEISEADFAETRHVHIEGYLAFNRALMERVLHCAKAAGCTTSFDMASFEVVKASEDVLKDWLRDHIDIVFANEDEASAFFPDLGTDYQAMAKEFAKLCVIAAVKLGKEGSLIAQGDELVFCDPVTVAEALDTTGAGDYWAGGFLYAWLQGKDLAECGRHGSVMGAEVVQVIGASLSNTRWDELRSELHAG